MITTHTTQRTHVVTVSALRRLHACENQVALFKQTFGARVAFTNQNIVRATTVGLCVGFFAVYAPGLRLADRERIAAASSKPSWWRGEIAAFAPEVSLADRERLAAASDHPAYWLGVVAARYGTMSCEIEEA